MNDTLLDLSDANRRRQRQWDPDSKISLSFRGNEIAGEVREACNIIKKLERIRLGLANSQGVDRIELIRKVEEELADVVICASLIANDLGIDLTMGVVRKFNKTSREKGLTVFMEPVEA